MPKFELNESEWYTPIIITETEGFDKDKYGNTWYSVVFDGDATQHLWLAKNRPTEGKQYYGHIEKTKSGKAVRFKTDKVPESEPTPKESASNFESVDKQDAISRSVALNNAVTLVAGIIPEVPTDVTGILKIADEFYSWLKNEKETNWADEAREELDD